MAGTSKQGGQRGNMSSASGRKERSATMSTHKGSRVEPSHLTEQAREGRAKDAAKAAKKGAKKK